MSKLSFQLVVGGREVFVFEEVLQVSSGTFLEFLEWLF